MFRINNGLKESYATVNAFEMARQCSRCSSTVYDEVDVIKIG